MLNPTSYWDTVYKCWPWYARYPLALGLSACSLLLRFMTLPQEAEAVFVTLYPAIILNFYLCGPIAGTLSALFSGLLAVYFFVAPYATFSFVSKDFVSLAYFYLNSLLLGYVITRLHTYSHRLLNQQRLLELHQRVYAASLEIDKLIPQKLPPAQIFQEVTRIMVENAIVKQAWIGRPMPSSGEFVLMASFGIDNAERQRLIESMHAQHLAAAGKTSPTGVGVNGKQHRAALPIHVGQQIYAVLFIYTAENEPLDTEAVRLLHAMTRAIEHALEEFNLEQERLQVDTQLRGAMQTSDAIKNYLINLLTKSPITMYACRATGDFGATFISDNVSRHLGYAPQEFLDDAGFWLHHIHPDDRARVLDELNEALQSDVYYHEYRFRHQNGDYCWVRDEFTVSRTADGQPLELVGYWQDITERRNLEQQLRFRQFSLDHIDEQIFWVDESAKLLDANASACQRLGYAREELLSLRVADVDPVFPCDQWHAHWREVKDKGSLRFESMHKTKAGDTYATEVVANFLAYEGLEYICALVRDITERKQLEEELKRQARVDFLTQVLNRRYFMEQAESELARALRYGKSLSILMLDIDFFKHVNDSYGHKAGDAVLQKLTYLCKQTLREIDIIGRLGGEEFAMLLPETTIDNAFNVAERLRMVIETSKVPLLMGGLPLQFTVSIGISTLSSEEDNIDVLLYRADQALYLAKNGGRNQVRVNVAT